MKWNEDVAAHQRRAQHPKTAFRGVVLGVRSKAKVRQRAVSADRNLLHQDPNIKVVIQVNIFITNRQLLFVH